MKSRQMTLSAAASQPLSDPSAPSACISRIRPPHLRLLLRRPSPPALRFNETSAKESSNVEEAFTELIADVYRAHAKARRGVARALARASPARCSTDQLATAGASAEGRER